MCGVDGQDAAPQAVAIMTLLRFANLSAGISTLAFAALTLSSCQAAPKNNAPISLTETQPVEQVQLPLPQSQPAIEPMDLLARMDRMEQQLSAAQAEIGAMRPKVAKIDVMEQKFKDLSLGLERIDASYGTSPSTPAVKETPVSVPAAKPQKKAVISPVVKPDQKTEKKKAPAKSAEPAQPSASQPRNEAAVYAVRLGEQAGYSRLVLDAGRPIKISYDLDNEEKILVVETGKLAWKAETAKSFGTSPLVSSYKALTEGGSTRLIVLLKKPVKILRSENLSADKSGRARSYIDLAPL